MRELRPYQIEAVNFIEAASRVVYADAPGTGKTGTTLAALRDLGSERTLIVAPLDVLRHWQAEANEVGYPDVLLGHGNAKKRNEARLCCASWGEPVALALNYEAVRSDWEHLLKLGFDTIVCDEAHRLKNRSSVTFKQVAKIARRVDSVVLVTGTPILNRADELWSLLHLIDPKTYPSYWRWANEHFILEQTTFGGTVIRPVTLVHGLKPGHEDALREQLRDVLIQRPLDVLLPDMPPVTEVSVEVELTPAERKAYDEMRRRFWTKLDDEVIWAPNEVAKITRLRQLASDWSAFCPDGGGSKVRATAELCRDLEPEQVLVLTGFQETAYQVAEALGPECSVVTGAMSRDARDKSLSAFKAGEARVLVGTLGVLREGVDGLQVARNIVLLDRDWTPARNEQAVARVRRSGQSLPVNVYSIVALDTIDATVDRALRDKRAVIDSILGRPLSEVL